MISRSIGFGLIAVLMGLAALAFGSVEGWAEAALRFGAAAAFVAVFWRRRPRDVVEKPVGAALLPAALIVAWGLFQTVPLPAAILGAISPRTARMKSETLPPGGGAAMPAFLLAKATADGAKLEAGSTPPPAAADAGSRSAATSLSITPYATIAACLAWVTPILLALASAALARDAVTRYRLLWCVASWSGILGAIAVLQRVAGNGKLLWIRPVPGDALPLGPFVNPNHFAAYVEMGLLVAMGLALAILGGSDGAFSRDSVRAAVLDRSWALPRLLALASICALAVTGLVLSGSRGGTLGVLAGCAVIGSAPWARRWLPAALVGAVALGLSLGFVSALGGERETLQGTTLTSGVNDASLDLRMDMWGRASRILADHPITGTGLATFPWAYASYDREGEWLGTGEAHNDYLQLGTETGLVGIALLLWLAFAIARGVVAPSLSGRSVKAPWTNTALAAAIFALVVHSVVEFNFQIPAVASLFGIVVGLLSGATTRSSEPPESAAA